ncbi:hypothetical protein RhiirC2_797194 [Rhizophagus irregularis]|uniref:Uncharacterized protein n=1 Tax=Rhizophagus irregularis TaxID=588596 RepID=A0A2N1M8E6_9GLOM|nr:hypothetical protein RhiirC2_797194 [Rhizophagus irregularis]
MIIITNWHQWYNIEVRGWYFLKPGKAKTSVDSHHVQIVHAIKRYICIRHCLDEGKNIQMAIAGLGGTSVANLDSRASKKLNNATVKTIAGITKLSYFEWPITEDYASYIQAQILPHIDIENFSLTNEWTLRNNQKYGKKGSGKRMTATVI